MTGLVLVTGGTGFVGRQVLQALSVYGIKVRLVIRNEKQRQDLLYNNIESIVVSSDLFAETQDWWTKVCTGVDSVLHVAWYASPGKYLTSLKNIDCLIGTLQMAQGAVAAGVKRFVGVGTCFEYDLTGGMLSVDTPLKPLTPYAAAKVAAFFALSQFFPQQGVEFAWCRLFYLYGEGEDERRLVPYLRSKLAVGDFVELTRGNQVRDYLDVKVAGERIVDVVCSDKNGSINICSGEAITIRQFTENIADEYGQRNLLRFGVRPDNIFDPPCVVGVL